MMKCNTREVRLPGNPRSDRRCGFTGTRSEKLATEWERLLQFAADNNLTIMNTVFQQHRRRLYTWTSPDGNHRNQIDYILIRSRWPSSIMNAHTLPGADCQSEHQLLVCKLKLKLRNSIPRKTNKRLVIADHTAFRNQLAADNSNWRSLAQLFSDSSTTPSCNISTLSQDALEPPILESEIRAVLEHLKRNKAVGIDTIPIEVFKAMGE